MSVARLGASAFVLPDGRVLVIGRDDSGQIHDYSGAAEIYDPNTNRWTAAGGLDKPRGAFAAVALRDGRILIAGGLTQRTGEDCGDFAQQAYSSTWAYDPASGGSWRRVGSLATARAEPAMVALQDGRALVIGGYYLDTKTSLAPGGAMTLASYHSGGTGSAEPRLEDVAPPGYIPALATAELFDPGSGTWSTTGSLKIARIGASAATLADGRVLVVGGTRVGDWSSTQSRGGASMPDSRSYNSAEIYDPTTGRFTLVGGLPAIDRAALGPFAAGLPTFDQPEANGILVALNDGGALLLGHTASAKHQGEVSRSFRFDPRTGRWSELGSPSLIVSDGGSSVFWGNWSDSTVGAMATRLSDGQVLVAGGRDITRGGNVSSWGRVLDPSGSVTLSLGLMPEPRQGGAAVTLRDGSVLIVGGSNDAPKYGSCHQGAGLASAIRLVRSAIDPPAVQMPPSSPLLPPSPAPRSSERTEMRPAERW